MQLTRQDIQIVEKIVTTEKGTFLARFAVANIAGTFKWKLLDMSPVEAPASVQNTVILIGSPKIGQIVSFIEPENKEIVSPYSELSFFVSQPPRAPTVF